MLNRRIVPRAPRDGPVTDFQQALVALIPFLRAVSRGMCGSRALSDDMVQETLERAWRSRASFEAGSNMKAWLFTILRNQLHSQRRRAWRDVAWDEALGGQIEAPPREQEWAIGLTDTARALSALPEHQREALILVAAAGYSHKEAAEIAGAAMGTMKSRVARARVMMSDLLDGRRPLPPRAAASATNEQNGVLAQLAAVTKSRSADTGARS
jgi:RNA polymerase sigma factor (sigma-70 family)